MKWAQLVRGTAENIPAQTLMYPPSQHLTRYSSVRGFNQNESSNPNIKYLIDGLEFRVTIKDDDETMKGLVSHFKSIIYNDKDKTFFGGEHGLSILHASIQHLSSSHLLYFTGVQDKHLHDGPRTLSIFSHDPWFLYAGGVEDNIEGRESFYLVKIAFPAKSYTQLRFPAKFIHGFEGNDLAAISMHYTDLDELKEKSLPITDARSNDVMEKLTTVIPPEKVKIITPLPLSYQFIQQLLTRNITNAGQSAAR